MAALLMIRTTKVVMDKLETYQSFFVAIILEQVLFVSNISCEFTLNMLKLSHCFNSFVFVVFVSKGNFKDYLQCVQIQESKILTS